MDCLKEMKSIWECKAEARGILRGNWNGSFTLTLVFLLIVGAVSLGDKVPVFLGAHKAVTAGFAVLFTLLSFLVVNPMFVGYQNAYRLLCEKGERNLGENARRIAFGRYFHNVVGFFLMTVAIVGWTLLLIVPGIVKFFAYAFAPYLLAERPELTPVEAIRLSDRMMKGHKWALCKLYLSFFGWILLGCLSAGIGFIWIQPYITTSVSVFYLDIRNSA